MSELFIEEGLLIKLDKDHFILQIELVRNTGTWVSKKLDMMAIIRLQAALNEKYKLEGRDD